VVRAEPLANSANRRSFAAIWRLSGVFWLKKGSNVLAIPAQNVAASGNKQRTTA